MKKLAVCFSILTSILFVAPATAQRVFDNFDRSQSVQVYLPPAPEVEKPTPKKRKGKNGFVQKTAMTANVTDGLASREGAMAGVNYKFTMGSNLGLKGFTTGNAFHDSLIVESSRRYGIDPLLIYAQMHQESTFKIRATSHKGASGLMQLMPATARRFGVTSIYDPKQNVEAGVRYMRWLIDTFRGDVVLALAGYNAGEGAVMKYGWNIPPYRETQEYVRRITSRYNQISDGRIAQTARHVSNVLASRMEQKEARPLTVLEPTALAVRLPNGQMMLVNQ